MILGRMILFDAFCSHEIFRRDSTEDLACMRSTHLTKGTPLIFSFQQTGHQRGVPLVERRSNKLHGLSKTLLQKVVQRSHETLGTLACRVIRVVIARNPTGGQWRYLIGDSRLADIALGPAGTRKKSLVVLPEPPETRA